MIKQDGVLYIRCGNSSNAIAAENYRQNPSYSIVKKYVHADLLNVKKSNMKTSIVVLVSFFLSSSPSCIT